MIWLKRLLPFIVLALAWFGWKAYSKSQVEKAAALDAQHAEVTALVWVASATLRTDPQAFLAYRDSLLSANNIRTEEMFRYLDLFENDLDRQLTFSQLVSRKVDSLIRIADSTRRVTQPPDTPNALSPGTLQAPKQTE